MFKLVVCLCHRSRPLCAALVAGMILGLTPVDGSAGDTTKEKMTLPGGTDGTSFESLVIQGEDRVQVKFERPELDLQLDPRTAMAFDFGDAHELVRQHRPDLQAPFLRQSAFQRSPFLGKPWLRQLSMGPVARFRPAVENIDRWRLLVADSRSQTVRTFEGKGSPPKEIAWDGKVADGSMALPGLTYSYSLEAFDRAGNKRTFVGDGFTVRSYCLQSEEGLRLVIGAEEMAQVGSGSVSTPRVLLDAASWINQRRLEEPVQITVTARTFEQADTLGKFAQRHLEQHLLGPAARIQNQVDVQATSPAAGVVAIVVGGQTPSPH